jgi:hypothetical protein
MAQEVLVRSTCLMDHLATSSNDQTQSDNKLNYLIIHVKVNTLKYAHVNLFQTQNDLLLVYEL